MINLRSATSADLKYFWGVSNDDACKLYYLLKEIMNITDDAIAATVRA
jgi:hypothetical protein